jgi:hypothetical protein
MRQAAIRSCYESKWLYNNRREDGVWCVQFYYDFRGVVFYIKKSTLVLVLNLYANG